MLFPFDRLTHTPLTINTRTDTSPIQSTTQTLFRCNRRSVLADFPNLLNYARDLYQLPGASLSVDMAHIRAHSYGCVHGVACVRAFVCVWWLRWGVGRSRD